jgi:hypothetical protein
MRGGDITSGIRKTGGRALLSTHWLLLLFCDSEATAAYASQLYRQWGA